MHTPRFCGQLSRAGLEVFHRGGFRPMRTSWLKVGTNLPFCVETHSASAIRNRPETAPILHTTGPFQGTTARITSFWTGPCSRRGDRWNLGASLTAGLVTQQAVAQEQKATLAEPFYNTQVGGKVQAGEKNRSAKLPKSASTAQARQLVCRRDWLE